MRNTPREVAIDANEKPLFVEVVRYFRKWDYKHDQISSSGGATIVCLLDYMHNQLIVAPSLCSDSDNFSKKIGLEKANERVKRAITFAVPLIRGESISNMISHGLVRNQSECLSQEAVDELTPIMYKMLREYI